MPLKPILDKAPLTVLNCQALRAGHARVDSVPVRKLYQLTRESEAPTALEGVFRLACLCTAQPIEEPVAALIRRHLEQQKEDGSFDLLLTEAIAVLRAAWALYEYEARKPVLEHIARWCGWASQNWSTLMADDALWEAPADLLELFENMYRVTGKAALLTLCDRLSSQTMAWSSMLNTISVQRPANRSFTREELEQGLQGESETREGYYHRTLRMHHGVKLADGARSALAKGLYSGSATELSAVRNSWERLSRYHGAVCAGLTTDDLLEGTSPSAAMSTAALGAWAEALAGAAQADDEVWAWEILERMAVNSLPACLNGETMLSYQRVNSFCEDGGAEDCFLADEDHARLAAERLARGYAAVSSCAVTARENGMSINLFLPGRYAVAVDGALLVVAMTVKNRVCTISLHCKEELRCAVQIRIPQWSRATEVSVNGMQSDAGKDCTRGYMIVDRTWKDGDVIRLEVEPVVRIVEGHHQGRTLVAGAVVMSVRADVKGAWANALLGYEETSEGLKAVLAPVEGWKARGIVPADVPVLPAVKRNEAVSVPVTAYANTPARMTLFAGGQAE